MPSERVLIVGAGVAGSIAAFWLAKHDFHVTVVERAKANQKLGQGLEIEEPALTVIKEMGILDELKARRTGELGFHLMDENDRSRSYFGIEAGFSPTGALEFMRGELTELLYRAADRSPNVTYYFETTIQSLVQAGDAVTVELQQRRDKTVRSETFDFVIGADGAKSRTRDLAMGTPEQLDCFKPVGAYVAYFSIPKEDRDWPNSKLCNFQDRRIVWLRPVGKDSPVTSAYFMYIKDNVPSLRKANASGDRQQQKEAFAELFAGLGWETPRVIEQMMKADNFYSDELVQVKLDKWSQDRVVLVGDAAWAPTPFTGAGNQLAIIGAWVLAQELCKDRSKAAFQKYDTRLRTYVENAQHIPFGGYAPYMCCPETAFGIWLFRTFLGLLATFVRLASRTKMTGLIPEGHGGEMFDLQIETRETKKIQ